MLCASVIEDDRSAAQGAPMGKRLIGTMLLGECKAWLEISALGRMKKGDGKPAGRSISDRKSVV